MNRNICVQSLLKVPKHGAVVLPGLRGEGGGSHLVFESLDRFTLGKEGMKGREGVIRMGERASKNAGLVGHRQCIGTFKRDYTCNHY